MGASLASLLALSRCTEQLEPVPEVELKDIPFVEPLLDVLPNTDSYDYNIVK